jgi:hypothetical protein
VVATPSAITIFYNLAPLAFGDIHPSPTLDPHYRRVRMERVGEPYIFPSTTTCVGDITEDSQVDGADLALILAAWGSCTGFPCGADLNDDHRVDGADLALVLASWGPC